MDSSIPCTPWGPDGSRLLEGCRAVWATAAFHCHPAELGGDGCTRPVVHVNAVTPHRLSNAGQRGQAWLLLWPYADRHGHSVIPCLGHCNSLLTSLPAPTPCPKQPEGSCSNPSKTRFSSAHLPTHCLLVHDIHRASLSP